MLRPALRLLSVSLLVIAVACSSEKPAADSAQEPAAALPADLFAAAPLEGATTLLDVKASAKAGDSVVFAGIVAGRAEPFTAGRAVMLVADSKLPVCTDGCATPWDACCEEPALIAQHVATIQVVDADGRPLKIGLKGQGKLEPGAAVQVRGTVSQAADGVFVVNAAKLHVPGGT